MKARTKIFSIIGLAAAAVIGVALLGAGLIVGLAVLGLLTVAYVVSKIFFRNKIHVRTMRIASCPSCGRITEGKVCVCGTRMRLM